MEKSGAKRDKQLASARKKLKKFKKKRTNDTENEGSLNNSDMSSKTSSTLSLQIDNYLEVKQNHESDHSDAVSENTENVSTAQNLDPFNLNSFSDTANTMENILELSAKLSDIAAQAKHLEDKEPTSNGVLEPLSNEIINKQDDSQSQLVNTLQSENKSLNTRIEELKSKIKFLSNDVEEKNSEMKSMGQKFQEEKEQLYNYGTKQQNMLQEQIQVQMQTIGVLVAEKQDLHQQTMLLERQLSNIRMQSENSGSEMQNLNKKCLMLQQDLTSQTEANTALEKTIQDFQKDKLIDQQNTTKLQESLNDAQMQKKELLQKLRMKEMNYTQLNTAYRELQEKFGMAEVLLQQMQSPAGRQTEDDEDNEEQLDEMADLHRRFEESQHFVTELMVERDRNKVQNEDIRRDLQEQINNLLRQISSLEEERNELVQYQTTLQSNLEQNREATTTSIKEEIEEAEEKENVAATQLRQQLTLLASAHEELQHEFNETIRNNEQLSQIIQDKEGQIGDLQGRLDMMNEEQMGHAKLLEETRGDKTAISRALAQNKQLKLQLEEIQEGFIKLSNDKMDLATQLNTAEHINTDVMKKLNEFEETINSNKILIAERDEEIVQLKSNMQQLHDTLQHQPDDSRTNFLIVQTLQSQLDASQETVNLLREQNHNLKELVSKTQSELDSAANIEKELREKLQAYMSRVNAMEATYHAEVKNTNETNPDERESVPTVETDQPQTNEVTQVEVDTKAIEATEDVVVAYTTQEEYKILQNNMTLLQDRFTKVINENAELNNKLEILQHLNTQLENECGTIGEYIALYHDQRQILKQRHREKDEYISSIAREREAMQNKVDQLQALVLRLLNKEEGDGDISNITIESHHEPTNTTEAESSHTEVQEEVGSISSDVTDLSDVSNHSQKLSIVGKAKRLQPPSEDGKINETAGQIMNLLHEMQKPGDPAMFDPNLIPSGFCMRYKGRYTAI